MPVGSRVETNDIVEEIFPFRERKHAVMILCRSDMMSSLCVTTALMTNLRKLCEYDSNSNSMDDFLEQSVGTL